MQNFLQTLSQRKYDLLNAFLEHFQISFISLFIAMIIAIPLGIYLARHKKIAGFFIGTSSVLQTIPSLALLALLIPLVGIGKLPSIIALVLYALLPILQNTYIGITKVAPVYRLAARAMGMSYSQMLARVEVPLAMPVIMGGIRISAVLVIATATIAALIGAGGLGSLILLGLDRNNTDLILLGAIPAALMALFADVALKKMSNLSLRKILIIFISFVILLAASLVDFTKNNQKPTLVLAGKLGTEPEILINMYKILIEKNLPEVQVELKPSFGKTSFLFNALTNKEIDIYPEFTATASVTFLKQEINGWDKNKIYATAKEGLAKNYDLAYLKPMAFNNTYALATSSEFAKTYNLEKISDLKRISDKIKAGFTLEFSDRQDGYLGLSKIYKLTFDDIKNMEPKLRYTAMQNKEINLIDAYSTDSELERYKLKVLQDDLDFFPIYQAAPLLRAQTLQEYPQLEEILNKLAGKVTAEQMRKMNYKVGVLNETAEKVAKEFLQENAFLNTENGL